MENIQEIVETWTMNNKGTLYLLENIETEWLSAKLAGKGRSTMGFRSKQPSWISYLARFSSYGAGGESDWQANRGPR